MRETVGRHVVAGGAGFLGSHLVDRLLSDGHDVVVLDNFATGRAENLAEARRKPRCTVVDVDIVEGVRIEGEVHGVWNLASPASPPDYQRRPIQTLRVGSEGTRHLLELAREKRARFLQASTSEVYGDPDVSPQPESYWGRVNPVGPRSMYDESKRYGEALVSAYRREGVDACIARIFNTYGPRMRLDDGRVVPNFLGQALRGEPLTVYGEGRQTRSFCYVSDLIDGLTLLWKSGIPGPVNLGNPAEITILEFAQAVRRLFARELPLRYLPLPGDDPMQRKPDIALARSQLGWAPRVPLDEGLRLTLASFQKAG